MKKYCRDEYHKEVLRVALALTCSLASNLKAQDLEVTSFFGFTIGDYNPDGSTINSSLVSGLSNPWGIAISGNNLFVVNTAQGTVGEYTDRGGDRQCLADYRIVEPQGHYEFRE